MCSSPSCSPHDPGHDWHRLVEGVLGLAGSGVVEDLLAGRPAELLRGLPELPVVHPTSVGRGTDMSTEVTRRSVASTVCGWMP